MPGEFDPSNHMMPQQPLHYCMFPQVCLCFASVCLFFNLNSQYFLTSCLYMMWEMSYSNLQVPALEFRAMLHASKEARQVNK